MSSGDTIPNRLGEFREIKERTGIAAYGHSAGTSEQTGVERLHPSSRDSILNFSELGMVSLELVVQVPARHLI